MTPPTLRAGRVKRVLEYYPLAIDVGLQIDDVPVGLGEMANHGSKYSDRKLSPVGKNKTYLGSREFTALSQCRGSHVPSSRIVLKLAGLIMKA